MRPIFFALAFAAVISAAPARAAPTCQDRNGDIVRCDVESAMPVGWTVSPEEFSARHQSQPGSDPNIIWELVCVMGVFFALMAMLPEFDGRRDGDWDREESDRRE